MILQRLPRDIAIFPVSAGLRPPKNRPSKSFTLMEDGQKTQCFLRVPCFTFLLTDFGYFRLKPPMARFIPRSAPQVTNTPHCLPAWPGGMREAIRRPALRARRARRALQSLVSCPDLAKISALVFLYPSKRFPTGPRIPPGRPKSTGSFQLLALLLPVL